jgi:dipeptidyl-peptidase-4
MKYLLRIITVIILVSSSISSQEKNYQLTLEQIFKDPEFRVGRFIPGRWLEGGKGYTTIENSEETPGGKDIVYYDSESGDRKILIPASKLLDKNSAPMDIDGYDWSADKTKLLLFTNTKRVWRINTRGDYYVLDLETNKLRQLGIDRPESSLMFAKFSPDGKRVGYVSKNNIYVEEIETGNVTQITTDGSVTIINGTFDWVYEEELKARDGFRWSPDGSKIAYWQIDAEGIGEFLMINNTDSIYSYTIPVQYPKVGTQNSAARVGVVSSNGGETTWMKIPGDPRNNYIARMEWAENNDEIVVQHLNRYQNKLDILLCNVKTGESGLILSETDEAWVDVKDDFKWFNNGNNFSWVSERDGWRHLYLVSRDGKEMKLLTPGEYDVISVENINDKDGWIYFIASPDDNAARYLYRVPFDGSGKLERITPADEIGTHSYEVSPSNKYAFRTFSNFNTPDYTDIVELPEHRVIRTLFKNEEVTQKVHSIEVSGVEFFKVETENNIILDGWIMKPYNFDETKKYPVIFFVYSEPAGQTVKNMYRSSRYLYHCYLAQLGYVIVSIDSRGTPVPRGRDWRKSVYKKIGIIAPLDQANGAKAVFEKFPFIDENRVGIWGWSGGGSMTLNMLFRYPEIYHTGISVAPVTNQKLYDTIYQERYMGLLDENEEGYYEGSPVNYAYKLEGNLLLIHGTGDDNVHYQNSELLINELIKHNKQFSFMPYPNRSHSIYEGKGTSLHLFTLMSNYFLDNLEPGGK